MRGIVAVAAALAGAAAALAAARPAQAIPAFSRKYQAPCALCHAGAFPALNAVGRRFKESGYQLLDPVESEARARHAIVPDPDERLQVLAAVPLALRAQSALVLRPDPDPAAGENAADLRALESLSLLAGAPVFPDVSFFASVTLVPGLALHHGAVGFHDLLFGEGFLNLRVGRLLLLDFARPEHRSLTRAGNPAGTVRVGLSPVALDSTQHGVDAYGRLFGQRLFWRLGVVQGAQGADGVGDLDGYKDVFAELQVSHAGRVTAMVGLLGYLGRTQITDEALGVRVVFTDRVRMAAATAELQFGRVDLFGQAAYVAHDNPSGTGEHADHWGFRGEARAALSARWLVVAGYDQVVSHHASEAGLRRVTVHLERLLLGNLRLALESAADLKRIQGSSFALHLDLAF